VPSDLYPERKIIRLHHAAYADPTAICSVTALTAGRHSFFQSFELTAACVDLLLDFAEAHGVPLYAYCFMPDHLHLLLSGSSSTSVFAFDGEIKSRSTRVAWQHGCTGKIWQRRFYDHLLRADEDVGRVEYILNTPVRKGIVDDWRDYPFSGSTVRAP
jgi:putative transposase